MDVINHDLLIEVTGGQRTQRHNRRKTLGPGGGGDPGNSGGRSVNNPFPKHTDKERKRARKCAKAIVKRKPWKCFT